MFLDVTLGANGRPDGNGRHSRLFKSRDQRHHRRTMVQALIQFAVDLIRTLAVEEISSTLSLAARVLWASVRVKRGGGPKQTIQRNVRLRLLHRLRTDQRKQL
jgi:hypothetical protein